jgi:hypothetical protein
MTMGAMTAATVVRAYLVIAGLFTLSASVIWSVNTLFLLDAGLNIFEVFIANAPFPHVASVDTTARQPAVSTP